MPRGKDQKTIAKRIDLHYWKKAHPLRTARRVLVLACCIVAAGWMAYAFGTKNEQIYNPGHVTGAHAMIENNCAACHATDPQRPNQFSKAVSDTACVKCHEAPAHAPTQLVRDGKNAGNRLALAAWMKENGLAASRQAEASPEAGDQPADAHHAGRLVSAQCAACHVEHRGREALASVSNSHCTQCHEDLSKSLAPGKQAQVPNRVVAFTTDGHPEFGRTLPKNEKGDGWVDNTKLKFNHKTHVVGQGLKDCSMCHTTSEPNPALFRAGKPADKPPFKVEGTAPMEWASGDGRYMRPVNYEQHCRACHPIKVTGVKGVAFAHDKIEVPRAQLLATFQQAALQRYSAGPSGAEAPKPSGRRGSSAKAAGPADEGEWLRGELEKLNKNVTALQKSCAYCHEMEPQKAAVAGASPRDTERRLRALLDAAARDEVDVLIPALWDGGEADVQLALMQQRRSRKPGGASATPAPAPAAQPAPEAPTASDSAAKAEATPAAPAVAPAVAAPRPRKPVKPVELQSTVPTGITNSPRRWFANSRFDHRSHRDMACVECHAKLDHADKVDGIEGEAIKAFLTTATTDTKEVLSPGMTWKTYAFTKAGEDKWSVAESTRSCTECHRQETGGARFATATCVTCHAYHDHSQEQFPDGRPEPRSRMTAIAAPAAAPADAPTEPAPEPAPEAAPAAEPAPAPAENPAAPEAAPAPAETAGESPASTGQANPSEEAQPAPAEDAPAPPAPARKSRRPRNVPGT